MNELQQLGLAVCIEFTAQNCQLGLFVQAVWKYSLLSGEQLSDFKREIEEPEKTAQAQKAAGYWRAIQENSYQPN